jgi:uncharacterized membrane protein YeaQ/YmgE (transglycosylase-associated protein family)
MNIILWIIFGALVGWVASLIMDTNKQQGALLNIGVGIVGALVGGAVMELVGGSEVIGFNFYSFLVALVGAIIFLGILKLVRRTI